MCIFKALLSSDTFPLTPPSETHLCLQARRLSADNQFTLRLISSTYVSVLYLMHSAIICLNPSLCAGAVSSACKQRGVPSRGGCTCFESACSPVGLRGLQRRLCAGKCRCVVLSGCPSALQLLLHRAAFCACAVRALSSEGELGGVFSWKQTHTHCYALHTHGCSAPLMCESSRERCVPLPLAPARPWRCSGGTVPSSRTVAPLSLGNTSTSTTNIQAHIQYLSNTPLTCVFNPFSLLHNHFPYYLWGPRLSENCFVLELVEMKPIWGEPAPHHDFRPGWSAPREAFHSPDLMLTHCSLWGYNAKPSTAYIIAEQA